MSPDPISTQLGGLSLGAYTGEEIKTMSVCSITTSLAIDSMGMPVSGSYYDARMGPLKKGDRCVTCDLQWRDCPGHMGCIELATMVYNPTFFTCLSRLLSRKCVFCHKLRCLEALVTKCEAQLLLLDAGLVVECGELCNMDVKNQAETSAALAKYCSKAHDAIAMRGSAAPQTHTIRQMRDQAYSQLIHAAGGAVCHNCGMASPTLRVQTGLKIFRKILSATYLKRNAEHAVSEQDLKRLEASDALDELNEDVTKWDPEAGGASGMVYVPPFEAYEELRRLWRQHPTLTDLLFGPLQPLAGAQPHALPRARSSPEAFFITVLAVPPNRTRPLIMLNGKMVDNPINVVLTRIITTNAELRTLSALHGADAPAGRPSQPYEHEDEHEHEEGPLPEAQREKFLEHSLTLQRSVNNLLDSTKAYDSQALPGIRQGLERKEGLFRMHVQGKRGNYAARSVIAPDPNLLTSEIGIPDVFARTLTFKEPVTRGNVDFMRKLVLNGPTYPGANSIQFENGVVKSLVDMPYNDRKVLADSLLVDTSAETADRGEACGLRVRTGRFSFNTLQPKVVSRHVLPGDPLILNRQPSLHRSSMLVHRARILPGHAKVIRFHFANCEALNADFDGDECNLYYPQTLPGVAEAEELVLNDRHYVTPTFGEPIRGLIQDHVIGGVLLCRVDAFRGRHEFLAEVAYACETRGFLGADDRRTKDQRLLGVEALNRVYTDNVFSAVNDLKFLGAVYTRADLAARPADDDAEGHAAGVTPSDLFKTPQSSLSERVLFRSNGDGFGGMREHYGRRAAAAAPAAGASAALRDGRGNAFRTRKATVLPGGAAVAVPPPAIAYPCPTWTGKQVVTAMLHTVADGREPLHYTGATRVPAALWGPFQATEGRVRIIANELVTGLVEKKHIAAADKGLVHGIFELYGHAASGLFLSNYGRLATHELQKHGLTCSLEDMILSGRAERARQKIYQQVLHAGPGVAQRFLLSSDAGAAAGAAGADASTVDEQAICKAIRHTNLVDDALYARFDATMSSEASNLTSSLIKACSPGNLVLRCHSRLSSGARYRSQKTFNSLAYMIMSGSKGSTVNLQMMTTCLGQQTLEGRRVPMTAAGRTLPCFSPYASVNFVPGGYVYDRFLTGIRPSSFFFHCQAGREGLIDTAVKTATSGYFQRVMIKNLEGLTVRYDGTVRDGDGSLVQTLYGGDAVDTCRRSYLHAFDFVWQNLGVYSRALLGPAAHAHAHAHAHEHEHGAKALLRRLGGDAVRHLEKFLARCASADIGRGTDSKERRRLSKTLRSLLEAAPGLLAAHWSEDAAGGEDAAFSEYELGVYYHGLARLPLQNLLSPYRFLGSVSSAFQEDLRRYVAARRAEDAAFDGEFFATLMRLKYMQSLIAPGEAVGLIASQSIGEPATQLTLNTFHLAGHGGANVTLGIPRLRELVMTASRAIKTPLMCIRLAGGAAPREAQEQAALRLVGRLQRIRLSEVVATIDIAETIEGGAKHHYVSLGLLRGDDLLSQHNLSCLNLKKVLVTRFVREFTKYADQALGAQQRAGVASIIQSVAVPTEAAPARGPGGPDGDNAPDGEGNAREGREASTSGDSDSESADPDAKGALEDSEPDQDASEEDAAARDTNPESGSGPGSDSEGSGGDAAGPGARAVAGRRPLAFDSEWVESSKQIDFLIREAVNSEKGAIHIRDISFKVVDGVPVFLVHSQVEITDRLLIGTLTERAVKATTIRAISGISRCFARFDKDLGQFVVDVEGSNLLCPRMLPDECMDLDSLYCNDVHAILRTYGVEAARNAIIAEMSKVFSVYHIDVDFRHLSIVADYMTQQGAYTPLNRAGIVTAPSVMQKASFETSVRFLSDGAIFGSFDNLQGLSGAVTTGQEAALGTGAFEVLQPVE